ncbi:hypothetical protein [Calothrix sp. CCY 0018]|uniref:DUF7925 domain-containing protein n=1 Tax=Calothrix sp. CCY 0018 TaxID=3103864 RepID=UPI0039C737EF
MSQKNNFVKKGGLYRSLLVSALIANGVFQFIAPVLADGTEAGGTISNTATATYEDPNNTGTPINTTSNTVTVTVAEVAGITISASGVIDNNDGTVAVGDLLTYTYTLTNVGNDPTRFHIPNQATTNGPGTVSGVLEIDKNGQTPASGQLQYSTDGGTTWTNVTPGGLDTPLPVPVAGTVLVRVPVTVEPGAEADQIIKVTLGNTPGDAQNQPRNPDGGDVYTVDNADGTGNGEVDGVPVNGTREASATEEIAVGSNVKTYALATVLKTRTGYNNAGTNVITDDKLTYNLSLRVEPNDPTGQGITPAALTGTTINVDGADDNYILVSDAIPAGTDLAVAPTAPPGWQAVYTTSLIASAKGNKAEWKKFPLQGADNLAGITRVGFINNPATVTSIAPGRTVNGFSIQLAVESTATAPLTVANIAQLFGQTPGTNTPVYDDSGDQNPSNYDGPPGNMTPPPGTDTGTDGVPDTLPDNNVDDGFIDDPANPETGVDTGNNNSGDGSTGGEANVFTVKEAVASDLLNGPQNAPDAIGPTDNNDDFTNKSSLVPAGTVPGSTIDPQSVGFTNTIKNSGTDAGTIALVPTPPATTGDLPDNTKVTITYNSDSVVYTYTQLGGFVLDGGTPITIPYVAPGVSINYGVEVDLPPGTALSTDIDRGFPVPITASIDNYTTDSDADGIKDSGNDGTFDSSNITIDRVYTGFLKLVKVSRILQGTGSEVSAGQDNFESTPAVNGIDPNPNIDDVPRNPGIGNIIEYQIRYKNISEAESGSGNVILNADKIVITEDGTKSPNNWALDNDTSGEIDTSNVVRSAKDSGASTIKFFSGNPASSSSIDKTGTTVDTDVTKYTNTVTDPLAPGIQRTFTFQRKVN